MKGNCGWISLTKALALDCEMVGVGYEGKRNALARVSLVYSTTQPLNMYLYFCIVYTILTLKFGVVKSAGESVG